MFGVLSRDALFAEMSKLKRTEDGQIAIECHQGCARTERVTAAEGGALLVVHMANAAEQGRAADGGPDLWVSGASQWGRWAKSLVERAPPVFDHCDAVVSPTAERAALEAYGRALPHVVDHPAAAAAEVLAAAARLPWVAEPVLLAGYCALRCGQWVDAFQYAERARTLLAQWGTAWDKRLTYEQWTATAVAIADRAHAAFADPAQAQASVNGPPASLIGARRSWRSTRRVPSFRGMQSMLTRQHSRASAHSFAYRRRRRDPEQLPS